MLNYLRSLLGTKTKTEYLDLTQHQIEALKHTYNLADAHTHQSQSPSQRKIVSRLPELWYEAEQTPQHVMEERFIETFFTGQNQAAALSGSKPMLVYAASIAMVITANYLLKKRMSVSLLEPCFDNLHDIMEHMQITMHPLKEEWLHTPTTLYDTLKANVKGDAVFIVDPNNPTGYTLFRHGKKAYKELIRFAVDHKKLLIFDFCFASFMLPDMNLDVFDVYQMLEESGVSYIAMEDTGKTWPVQDTKAAIIKTSHDLYDDIYNIHTSYLLNVSPFILNLLTQYLKDSERDQFASVFNLLDRNRAIAKKTLEGSLLEYQEPSSQVSVAWFAITDPAIRATDLQQVLYKAGVYVLPGTYFFWSDPSQGERYIRIALARNTTMFRPALKLLRKTLDSVARS